MGQADADQGHRYLSVTSGSVLYGALVSASTLVVAGSHADDYRSIAGATAGAVAVFWLAHAYVFAETGYGAARPGLLERLRDGTGHEFGVLAGGIPAIVVYVLAVLVGMQKTNAATVSVWFSVGLLLAAGWLTAHRAGVRGLAVLVDAVAAGLLGVLVVIGKALLH